MSTRFTVHSVKPESLKVTVRRIEEGDFSPFAIVELSFVEDSNQHRTTVQLFLEGANLDDVANTTIEALENVTVESE